VAARARTDRDGRGAAARRGLASMGPTSTSASHRAAHQRPAALQLYLQHRTLNSGTGTFRISASAAARWSRTSIRYDGVEGTAIIDAAPGNLNGEVPSRSAPVEPGEHPGVRVDSNNYPAEYAPDGGQVTVVTSPAPTISTLGRSSTSATTASTGPTRSTGGGRRSAQVQPEAAPVRRLDRRAAGEGQASSSGATRATG